MRWIFARRCMANVPVQDSKERPLRSSPWKKARYVKTSEAMSSWPAVRSLQGDKFAPRAGIEVDLIQYVALGMTGVQRHDFRQVRVPIDDVLGAAGAEVGFRQGMRRQGIAVGPRSAAAIRWSRPAQPAERRLLNRNARESPSTGSSNSTRPDR